MPNYAYPKRCYNMLRSLASAGKTIGYQIAVNFCVRMVLGMCGKLILFVMLQEYISI